MNGIHEKKHKIIDDRLEVLNKELDVVELELELLAAIIQNLSEGVMLAKTTDGTIVYTNPQMNKLFGYEKGELKGKHVSVLNAPHETSKEEEAQKVMDDLKANPDKTRRKNILCVKKDGSEFLCFTKISTFEHKTYGEVWVALHTTSD